MLKPLRTRYLIAAYLMVLVLLLVVSLGCSTKQDPAETLELCGNHSCGDLAMVTVDTSSDGYQYLEPAISPDGMQVAFTADWSAIPSDDEYDGEPRLERQILIMPIPVDIWSDSLKTRDPVSSIRDLDARLVRLDLFESLIRRPPGDPITVEGLDISKGGPLWVDDETLIILARFSRRDRFLMVDVSGSGLVVPEVLFYEQDDLLETGGYIWYHNDPALSPDGRWLVFTRFGCDNDPNIEGVTCTGEALWVLDMTSIGDPTDVVIFPLTTEAVGMEDPTWSPDGRTICFSASVDLVGDLGGTANELFRVNFDPDEAAAGSVALDRNLQRLTFTEVAAGDPIVGLHNYAPWFSSSGNQIYFVSSRRTPGSTLRIRSIWQIPADGRLEPALVFFSRYDDVDPAVHWPTGELMLASRMGFPTEQLDAIEARTVFFYTYVFNDTAQIPLTDVEIERRASDVREELEFFEDVMSHLYLFRGF